MQKIEESGELYFAVGDPTGVLVEPDCVGITDAEDGDFPIGVAVPDPSFPAHSGATSRFYLVVAGRELPGSWIFRDRRFAQVDCSQVA